MANGDEMLEISKRVGDDLEPYRRLIEIQKELVEMSKQHEQTRRECDALRELVTREMIESLPWRGKLRHHLRQSASRLLRRPSRRANAKPPIPTLNPKQPFSC